MKREHFSEASLIVDSKAIALPPQLYFTDLVWKQLLCYYSSIDTEFQLMGFVEKEEGVFRVTELAINAQYVGHGHADNDEDKFCDLLRELEAKGKDVGKLRFQTHSHGRFSTYFSRTDVETIRDGYACDWMISMVGNRKLDFSARLDVFEPVPLSISLPIFVEPPLSELSPAELEAQEEKWFGELRSQMTFGRKEGV